MNEGTYPLRRIGEMVENYNSRRMPVKASKRVAGPYPYYGAQGIVDYVDDYIFEGEYVLVAEDGENLRSRKAPIATMANGKFWVNNHAHIMKGNEHNSTRYIYYAVNNSDVSGYVSGSTIPKLSQKSLNEVLLPCPEIKDQQAIVGVLGTFDDKIALNRKMNGTLQSMMQEIFRDWFTNYGPTRAKMQKKDAYLSQEIWDMFPDKIDKHGKPEGWRDSIIGNETHLVRGSTPSTKKTGLWGGGIKWATPKDLSGLDSPIIMDTARTVSESGVAKISSGLMPIGTVLLSSRAPVGYLAITDVPMAIGQGLFGIICEKEISNIFVWLWTLANMEEILLKANGTTFLEISKNDFKSVSLVVPPKHILLAFDSIVVPLYFRIKKNEKEICTLTQMRNLLLPKLMSGQIRVSNPNK